MPWSAWRSRCGSFRDANSDGRARTAWRCDEVAARVPDLRDFTHRFSDGQRAWVWRWLADMVVGHARAGKGRTVVSEIARALPFASPNGQRQKLITREVRLCNGLKHEGVDDELLWQRYMEYVRDEVIGDTPGNDIVVSVDESAIPMEYARRRTKKGMGAEYIHKVHDGAADGGREVLGYNYLQVHLSLPDGTDHPFLYHLFSIMEPEFWFDDGTRRKRKPQLTLEKLDVARRRLPPECWYAFDAGYSGTNFWLGLDELGLRTIIRVNQGRDDKMSRKVITADGKVVRLIDLVNDMKLPYQKTFELHEKGSQRYKLGCCRVYLRDSNRRPEAARRIGRERTLVVAQSERYKSPLVLLVNERVRGRRGCIDTVLRYDRRWACEVANKRLKSRQEDWGHDLHMMRLRSIRGLRRMMFCVLVHYAFLCRFMDAAPTVARRIVERYVESFKDEVTYGSVIRAVRTALQEVPSPRLRRWLGRV